MTERGGFVRVSKFYIKAMILPFSVGRFDIGLSESIKRWEVSEPSLSDHRNILFNLEGFVPECLVRNSTGTS
jgi:hypothetical protein